MTCTCARNLLLQLPRPDRAPVELRDHLRACPDCRAYRRRLTEVDRAVTALPVPPSRARAELIQKILAGDTAPARPRRRRPHWRPRIAAALAASLLLVVLTRWGGRPPEFRDAARPAVAPVVDQTLANVLEHHVRLASADTARQRVEGLAGLAHEFQDAACTLAPVANGEDLTALADLYGLVVRDGVLRHATGLDPDERQQVLPPVRTQLAHTVVNADQLVAVMPLGATEPLQAIAVAAREGHSRLAR